MGRGKTRFSADYTVKHHCAASPVFELLILLDRFAGHINLLVCVLEEGVLHFLICGLPDLEAHNIRAGTQPILEQRLQAA